jgi:hypothetical protein
LPLGRRGRSQRLRSGAPPSHPPCSLLPLQAFLAIQHLEPAFELLDAFKAAGVVAASWEEVSGALAELLLGALAPVLQVASPAVGEGRPLSLQVGRPAASAAACCA